MLVLKLEEATSKRYCTAIFYVTSKDGSLVWWSKDMFKLLWIAGWGCCCFVVVVVVVVVVVIILVVVQIDDVLRNSYNVRWKRQFFLAWHPSTPIVDLNTPLLFALTQPGGCDEWPGDAAGFLPEIVLPPMLCICQSLGLAKALDMPMQQAQAKTFLRVRRVLLEWRVEKNRMVG